MTDIQISGEATRTLAAHLRQWSGWPDASLHWGNPAPVSDAAMCDLDTRRFIVNPDKVILNPNRVLRTVTPHRLGQEAVLTGALLHEAAHARFTRWVPDNPAEWKHGDGTTPTDQTIKFALLLEEPRIEGRMIQEAQACGSQDYTWTMQASAAHLIPLTQASVDPTQALMDLVTSWVLRVGRWYVHRATLGTSTTLVPSWVHTFTETLVRQIDDHAEQVDGSSPSGQVYTELVQAITKAEDTGPDLLDRARDILALLRLDQDGGPTPQGGCHGGTGADGDADGGTGADGDATLQALEAEADAAIADILKDGGSGAGDSGDPKPDPQGWRQPTPSERQFQRSAEQFLRDLIDPTEVSTESLTDSPAARVDGAAMAAWKASGSARSPRFFRHTQRSSRPAPPVQVAVLVDVSYSMAPLQEPSALLSWAIANAALDLQNFAGRGQQIESCLIHWGSRVQVVQGRGATLKGIREVGCNQFTSAMAEALGVVKQELPGFFDPAAPGEESNRLLVQFTDWELSRGSERAALAETMRALRAGVNMLTVAPPLSRTYGGPMRETSSYLPQLEQSIRRENIKSATGLVIYDPRHPDAVWSAATQMLKK